MRRDKSGFRAQRYPLETLLKVIRDFYYEHGKVPTMEDIELLSRQNKSPCFSVFTSRGGFKVLVAEAGIGINTVKNSAPHGPEEVLKLFRAFVLKYKSEHDGTYPSAFEFTKGTGIHTTTLKKCIGMTYTNALIRMGNKVRRSRIANLPGGAYK